LNQRLGGIGFALKSQSEQGKALAQASLVSVGRWCQGQRIVDDQPLQCLVFGGCAIQRERPIAERDAIDVGDGSDIARADWGFGRKLGRCL
jgi:hypothetical protein